MVVASVFAAALSTVSVPAAAGLPLAPERLQLVDLPATVPAGSEASVGAFVPRGARCRLVVRDAGTAVWKGPGAKATSGFMQFPWTQQPGVTGGQWRLRVKCRTDVIRWKSTWGAFWVTANAAGPASVPTLNRPASASLSAVPASYGWAPFGTTLVKGTEWFNGRGVDVRSNGGNGCASGCAVRHTYGTKFDKHAAGGGYRPVPGDIIVWTGGSSGYGHVAVVSWVDGDVVTFVEQNASRTGSYQLKADATGRLARYGSLKHIGYLHAKANV